MRSPRPRTTALRQPGPATVQPPQRQVRAVFDESTITVYQAYSAAIAIPAAANNTFAGTAFSLNRMTWIKPSFLWMMYRSGWGTKPGQEHILAIQITRAGFEEALSSACLSHFDQETYPDHATWAERKQNSPVRVQWDPERTITLDPLPWRSIQVGLSRTASEHYVNRWIVHITDITSLVHEIHRGTVAPSIVQRERAYPLGSDLTSVIGASR